MNKSDLVNTLAVAIQGSNRRVGKALEGNILPESWSDYGRSSGKGQLRNAKPKASGAAQLKRAAKKRNNIRKHG